MSPFRTVAVKCTPTLVISFSRLLVMGQQPIDAIRPSALFLFLSRLVVEVVF